MKLQHSKVYNYYRRRNMPKYLIQANYTEKGLAGLMKEGGSKRQEAVTQAIKAMGGTLEAMYYAFGDYDVYAITDMPDNVSATAISIVINAAGGATTKTTVLITPEEVDQAVKKSVTYRPPGQQMFFLKYV
jgi:uncharacterized protein with GYD domain